MAVVIKDSCGAIIDHSDFKISVSTSINQDQFSSHLFVNYKIKKELFEVYTPFYMESQAQRILRESLKDSELSHSQTAQSVEKETSAQKKRRKKKPPHLSDEDEKVSELIERVSTSLISKATEHSIFITSRNCFLQTHDNNKASKLSAKNLGCGELFQEMEGNAEINGKLVTLNEKFSKNSHRSSLFIHNLIENSGQVGIKIGIENDTFLIPASSRFLMSSFSKLVSGLYKFLTVPCGYDLVVIDPPWYNKSVKRKKSYCTFDESELCSLPLHSLTKTGSLICLWVTNNERILSYVKDVVLPTWNVQWISDWYWMKVTKCGEPVCDIRSPHKKTYERLVIGQMMDRSHHVDECSNDIGCSQHVSVESDIQKTMTEHTEANNLKGTQYEMKSSIPKDFVLISVPCSLHSKKPFLSDVLSPYLPSHPKCLEMFARNLTSGWTSWGNEVLRHQHIDYYEKVS